MAFHLRPAAYAGVALSFALVGCSQAIAPTQSQYVPSSPALTNVRPAGGASYSVLHSFGQGLNGSIPIASLYSIDGALYSTTSVGGSKRQGTVYSISALGAFSIVHSFGVGSDGTLPYADLVNVNGLLYGTTYSGGVNGGGTVFSIDPNSGDETVLYSFGGGTDGVNPQSNLTYVNGLLYGTTLGGGTKGHGTAFSVDPNSGSETVLHSFGGTPDGSVPSAGLTDVNGVLYGTTYLGGSGHSGTVFSLTTDGAEKVLHSFGGGADGSYPMAGLIFTNSRLYGTTKGGGAYGRGTVFRIATSGNPERVVCSFKGGSTDGAQPVAGLLSYNGIVYGTTQTGGTKSLGTIFRVNPKSRVEKVLHNFTGGTDGSGPQAALVQTGGVLYGTTARGGSKRYGTVFAYTP